MYLSYVDESGDTGRNGSRHLLLGAAALFEGRWSYRPGECRCCLLRRSHGEEASVAIEPEARLVYDAVLGRHSKGPVPALHHLK